MKLLIAAAMVIVTTPHVAHAFSACNGEVGWSPQAGDEVPTHAHLVFWSDRAHDGKPMLIATLDGKPVKTIVTTSDAAPYKLTLVEIDSGETGKLEIGWKDSALVTYQVKAKVASPREAHAKTDRFHHKLAHSTVREVFDGLAIRVDVPATLAHVKLRRDDKAPWVELDAPVGDYGDDGSSIRVGELGCTSNYSVQLLEGGVDIDVDLTLPDGKHAHVADLKRVTLAKLQKPTSDKPWDSE